MPPVVEAQALMSSPVRLAVTTSADDYRPVNPPVVRSRWNRLIDHTLIKWEESPDYFADEDFDGPQPEIIQRAIEVAMHYAREGRPVPDRVVPDADGGIVFERRQGTLCEKIHLWADGLIEYVCLSGSKVVNRHPLDLP